MTSPSLTGPSLLIVNPKAKPTEEKTIRQVVDIVRDTEFSHPDEPGLREKAAKQISTSIYGLFGVGRWDWEKWTEISPYDPLTYIPASEMKMVLRWASNDPRFEWERSQQTIMYYFFKRGGRGLHPFPDDQPKRVEFLLSIWKRILVVFQPEFALIDDYPFLHKKKGADLRQTAWGVTIFGPGLAKQLGLGKLQSAGFWRVEQLPWGGVWAQVAENPFQVPADKRKEIEKKLGLKSVFESSTRTPMAKTGGPRKG